MIDDGDTWCLLIKWLWYYACSCGLSVSQRQMWWHVRQLHTLERNFSVTSSGAFEFVSVCVQTTPTSVDTISASDPRDLHKIQNWGESIALIITPICHCRHHHSHRHLLHYCSTKSMYLIKCSYTFYLYIFTISGLMLFTSVCTSVAPLTRSDNTKPAVFRLLFY